MYIKPQPKGVNGPRLNWEKQINSIFNTPLNTAMAAEESNMRLALCETHMTAIDKVFDWICGVSS